ncbi:hypothetical protein CSW57_22810 [Williamsia muralis]|uniref:Uncharacterized protein n=2 Tax=Williamsia marianensis TaxID=85044 RepID=A0A2G3PFW0_WILMA|nr:hypothetical protein CSW57_22810 [Williamsia marianensis]
MPEVVAALRNPDNHRSGRLNGAAIDAADNEFRTLAYLATEHCNLSLAGIPTYRRANGELLGISPRMRPVQLVWLRDDVRDRLNLSMPWLLPLLMRSRGQSIRVSRAAQTIMLGLRDSAMEYEFAAFRHSLAA